MCVCVCVYVYVCVCVCVCVCIYIYMLSCCGKGKNLTFLLLETGVILPFWAIILLHESVGTIKLCKNINFSIKNTP